jgi:hypothetical protein
MPNYIRVRRGAGRIEDAWCVRANKRMPHATADRIRVLATALKQIVREVRGPMPRELTAGVRVRREA